VLALERVKKKSFSVILNRSTKIMHYLLLQNCSDEGENLCPFNVIHLDFGGDLRSEFALAIE